MHVYTFFFNSVKLISMSTNSNKYWKKIKFNNRSSVNGRGIGKGVKELYAYFAGDKFLHIFYTIF